MGTDGELLSRVNNPDDESERFRNITIGNDEQTVWKVFCILPNLDGQKYTLGESFISGEDQGEFIFLPKVSPHPTFWSFVESNNLCEVQVVNDKYFVTPLKLGRRNRAVYVNDVQISKSTEFQFGDYLSLDNKNQKFLFAERFYSNEGNTNGPVTGDSNDNKFNAEFAPGQNELILSHILSYLPVKDVKGFRLVARLWSQAAMPIIRKRCRVTFNFEGGYHNPLTSMKFFMYNIEMKDNSMTNFAFNLPSCKHLHLNRADREAFDNYPGAGAKLLTDFDKFLSQPFIQKIKKLEVGGNIAMKLEFDLRIKLFQAVQPTLQELVISGNCFMPLKKEKDRVFPDTITFPNLRSFTLSWMDIEDPDDKVYFINWFKNIVHGNSRVASVHLDCDPEPIPAFLDQLHQVSDLFANLEELSVFELNPKIVKKLLELKLIKPLKKLQLSNTYDFEFKSKKDFGVFEQLLAKFAPALEQLEFTMPHSSRTSRHSLPSIISLPAFPYLKYLEISWDYDYCVNQGLELVFPGGIINYEKDFPSLKSLVFLDQSSCCRDDRTRHCRNIYEGFFPPVKDPQAEPRQICKSVQVLDIRSGMRKEEALDKHISYFTKSVILAIAAMFPQASNYDWLQVVGSHGIVRGPQND